jgi:hypothetical protein
MENHVTIENGKCDLVVKVVMKMKQKNEGLVE